MPSSTLVDRALPPGAHQDSQHGNLHHNVPESRCGSENENNLSNVLIPRHNHLHKWVGNRHPVETIGTVALQSITHPNVNKRVDPTQLHVFLEHSRSKNVYWEKATVTAKHSDSIGRLTQDLFHTTGFIREELGRTRDALAFIRGEVGELPAHHHDLLDGGKEFFGVRTAAEVIEGLVTEKHSKEFSWVKPMRFDIRQRLEFTALNREGTTSEQGGEYVWALREHESQLQLQLSTIGYRMTQLYDDLRMLLSGMGIQQENVA